MLQIIIRIFTFFITPTVGFYVIRNFIGKRLELKKINVFVSILTLVVVNFIMYNVKYNIATTIITFLSSIIVYKFLFKMKLFESIIAVSIFLVLLTLGDVVASAIMVSFVNASSVRVDAIQMFVGNCLVAVITCVISRIKFVRTNISKFIETYEGNKKLKIIVFFLLSILLILILIYIISTNYELIRTYWFSIVIIAALVILFLIFIKENNSRMQFETRYLELIEYSKTFEEMIDNDRLLIHEHKNELAAIKSMNNIKEVRKYIDNVLDYDSVNKGTYIEDLKHIPKGGLKGLIYYKLIVATNRKLNLTVSISKNVKGISKINSSSQKQLLQILGICLDNAIEASASSKKKEISLEIYELKGELNIVICNTFNEKSVDLSKINEKGYSTKGTGRGNGLYYLTKIVNSQNLITTDWKIINKYFVRKIVVKLDKQ